MIRLKAEWETQNTILMALPHKESDWAEHDLKRSRIPFGRIAQAIAYSQPVYMLCHADDTAEDLFCSKRNIILIKSEYNDTWTRDYGPLSVETENGAALVNFKFNGWGGKYDSGLDGKINGFLHRKGYFGTAPMRSVDFILEGGSIDCDGNGTVLTTTSCLCNPNRNGGQSKDDLQSILREHLGIERILWLDHGYLAGDDTDGHIDMLARFTDAKTIVYIKCDDPADEHYRELLEMERELKSFRTLQGDPYNLVALPMCEPKYDGDRRLPASYANFLISNKALLYPSYDDTSDRRVAEIFRELFPDREIIPVPCSHLLKEGGSLHCSTMQISY